MALAPAWTLVEARFALELNGTGVIEVWFWMGESIPGLVVDTRPD
jgi:hypothetical protein